MIKDKSRFFQNFEEAASHIIDVLKSLIQAETIFIATNDGVTNKILKAFNRAEILVEEGGSLPYKQSYCSLVGREPVVISSTLEHSVTKELDITVQIGDHSFVGVPISYKSGRLFGTLCVLDRSSAIIKDEDIQTLSSMAMFLSYIIELERIIDLEVKRNEMLYRDKKEFELKVQKLRNEVQMADQMTQHKSEFLAIITHELRNAINGTIGMSDLLETTELSEQQQEYMDLLKSSNNSLLSLVNNILDYSKIEAGKAVLEEDPFDLVSTVEDSIYSVAPRTLGKPVEVILDVAPDIPTYLLGDAEKVRQILLNFLSNAVKFTHEGEILVCLRLLNSSDEDQVYIQITIQDSGVGIAEEKISQLFQYYYQAHENDHIHHYGGTGLGLAIAQNLVNLMDGSIEVESKVGEGTKISIILGFKEYAGYDNLPFSSSVLKQMKILIIDDNDTSRQSLGRLLKSWGIEQTEVSSTAEAMIQIQSGLTYDLLLMDISIEESSDIRTYLGEDVPIGLLAPIGTTLNAEQKKRYAFLTFKPFRRLQLYNALIACQTKKLTANLID
ncbi:hybrid sensor histidine kinase/response regulator [Paenibacillus sp. An7]|uniref:hybrid sensor histidine kinase/response regulator n=1 Tax=Paenibacillus sp. An7 TaxID=2689577 RepID=UPI00135CE76B|nr:ATP-binding protein [Paenibacillus sp. An7]